MKNYLKNIHNYTVKHALKIDGVVKPPRKIRLPTRLKWTGFYGEVGFN
jgi:hypothetical protein